MRLNECTGRTCSIFLLSLSDYQYNCLLQYVLVTDLIIFIPLIYRTEIFLSLYINSYFFIPQKLQYRHFFFCFSTVIFSAARPTTRLSTSPTLKPTSPTGQPTGRPTSQPTRQPTSQPTGQPTGQPTRQPTGQPTQQPTSHPSRPTGQPTSQPTSHPTVRATPIPTISGQPSARPTPRPSPSPTLTSLPTITSLPTLSTPTRNPSVFNSTVRSNAVATPINKSLTTGEIAGCVIGSLVGAVLVLFFCFYCFVPFILGDVDEEDPTANFDGVDKEKMVEQKDNDQIEQHL